MNFNMKELSKQEEKFVGGHTLCGGCGEGTIVRAVMNSIDKPVVVATATGCLEVSTTRFPFTSWKTPWIHNAFENVGATISGVEAAYKALKRKGKIKGDIKFVAFAGDGGTYDIGLQSLSGALERGHDFVFVCLDNEAYMNCLSLSSLILTKDGLKKITEVKKGDLIYAFNQKTHNLVLKKCTGVFNNGRKKVYEISTFHHNIRGTSNHPFLTVKKNGRGKKNELIWKKLEELKKGDHIIALKNIDTKKSFIFKEIKISKKGDYKVNKINKVEIPKRSSPELMEYLGLFLGDGWVRVKKANVGFSLPEGKEERKRLITLHLNIFKSKTTISANKNELHVHSVNIARFIDSLGFGQGAKKKTIPRWVFTLPKKEKEAFIEGLLLSDGWKHTKNSFRYTSSSKDLLVRLRLLLQTINYRVGKIHWQKKKKGTKVVYRPLLKDSEYGYISFSKKQRWNVKKYPSQYKYQNFLIGNKFFETEKVMSKKLVGIEPTLDLRVEGEHNFIADGIVVHNTGIQRSSATPFGAWTNTSQVGKAHVGKEQFRKDIMAVVLGHDIPYAAQASPSNWLDLVKKANKAFETKGPAFINVISPCVPGWKYKMEDSLDVAKMAVETNFWPLYEVENGVYKLNYEPEKRKPIEEWLKMQGRFKHMLLPANAQRLHLLQSHVDSKFEELKKNCECFK